MRRLLLPVITLAFVALLTEGALSPPERSYKILMLLPVSSKSHRSVFLPLAEALVERGHKVTMLSNHHFENSKIEHYNHSLVHFRLENFDLFKMARNPSDMFAYFRDISVNIANEIYDDPIVQKLYARKDEFELIFIDGLCNEAMYPFAYKKKLIMISTEGLNPKHSALQGNLLNPAYVSNLMFDFPQPYSFVDKVKNIILSIVIPWKWENSITAPAFDVLSKKFPELPSLLEIEANQSLALLNSHFSLDKPVPLLPNQVEVGCMHCRSAKSLPSNLEKFLSGDKPVVYMSLGSIARSTTIPASMKSILLKTFTNLPYKVIWKYEDDTLGKLPDNVLIMKWMPQQDILAHKNVKAFISHCGLLSTQEAMFHATPVVGLPIGVDQKKNAARLESSDIGLYLNWDELTEEMLDKAIKDVVTNQKYHTKVNQVSRAFRDQLEDPTERAVFWTEYVIRHDGAPHLRSPARDLSWIQLLHLDILFALHLVLYLTVKVLKKLGSLLFGSPKESHKIKKN